MKSIVDQNMKCSMEMEAKNKEIQSVMDELADITDRLASTENQLMNVRTELSNKNKEILHYKLELNYKIDHIERLLIQERRLQQILNSTGWKLLLKLYHVRDALFPNNSRRKIIAKLLLKSLNSPREMLSKLNRENFKKLIYYFKNEDLSRLEQRIETSIGQNSAIIGNKDLQIFNDGNFCSKLIFKKVNIPTVSIVIPVYNQWNYTYACLVSILEHTNDISYEVIVADDKSTDETVSINKYVENVTVVRDGQNRGFLLNCNYAASYAKGKYIFFLNNDTNVQPEWLSSLVTLMEKDHTIGLTGSKLIYPDGRQQEAGGIIWNDASGWNYGRLDDPSKPEYNYLKEVDYISGAAILIRKSLWEELGGFDERYAPAYFEDTDLAFAVRKLGYKVVYQPRSVVVHFEGMSHGTNIDSGIKSYQVSNQAKFLKKWKTILESEHFHYADNGFLARDRSKGKKMVVIVDRYVPHYDRDAGGRCTYLYIKQWVLMGFKVVFIGDSFLPHEPYTSDLQQLGVEVLYGDWYAKNVMLWIKKNGHYIHYIYLNRPYISKKYIDACKKYTNAKIIYFGHDLHYVREMRNYEVTRNPSLLESVKEWKKMEFHLFAKADVIYVVGCYEQQLLQEYFPHKPIRNIPLYIYPEEQRDVPPFQERRHLLFVGGFNHKPNYDGVKWFLNSIWPFIKEREPDLLFYVVGSNPPENIRALNSDRIIVTGHVSDEKLEEYYRRARIVIVPLRFGAGVKGKVVEAIRYRIPVVTTSVGAEGLENIDAVVKIADREQDFAQATLDLYENEDKWNKYSSQSDIYIKQYFSIHTAKSILALDVF